MSLLSSVNWDSLATGIAKAGNTALLISQTVNTISNSSKQETTTVPSAAPKASDSSGLIGFVMVIAAAFLLKGR